MFFKITKHFSLHTKAFRCFETNQKLKNPIILTKECSDRIKGILIFFCTFAFCSSKIFLRTRKTPGNWKLPLFYLCFRQMVGAPHTIYRLRLVTNLMFVITEPSLLLFRDSLCLSPSTIVTVDSSAATPSTVLITS